MKIRQSLSPLGLLVIAAVLHYWIAPLATRLPDDYSSHLSYVVEDRIRESLEDAWQTNTFTAQRTDQILSNPGEVAIFQGNLSWSTDSGQMIFENVSLYGVDRRTRLNLAGYGDVERSGQYLFPPHVKQTTYTIWDPMFIGPRSAVFDHKERLDGLVVYVFHFSGSDIDETKGYDYLLDVPEHYLAYTDGQGRLWIEPLTGVVVDYEEQGVSFFVDPTSRVRLAESEFHRWSDRYTPETRAAQLALARAARLRILALENWLPVAFLTASSIWMAVLGIRNYRTGLAGARENE